MSASESPSQETQNMAFQTRKFASIYWFYGLPRKPFANIDAPHFLN
jgi:hypothetical protein